MANKVSNNYFCRYCNKSVVRFLALSRPRSGSETSSSTSSTSSSTNSTPSPCPPSLPQDVQNRVAVEEVFFTEKNLNQTALSRWGVSTLATWFSWALQTSQRSESLLLSLTYSVSHLILVPTILWQWWICIHVFQKDWLSDFVRWPGICTFCIFWSLTGLWEWRTTKQPSSFRPQEI